VLHHELGSWQDPAFAREWAARDALGGLLGLPRRLAAAVVAHTRPDVRLVIDVASGPGAFLGVFLEAFPEARGVWTDGSPAMEEQARTALARFGDRVEYRSADMSRLGEADLPSGADVVLSSRASHHLEPEGLCKFYREGAALLAPGGWLANLDHTGRSDRWMPLHREVLRSIVGDRPPPSHTHQHAAPTVGEHLAAARAAGLDVDIVWATGRTVLLQGAVPDNIDSGSNA
jgi:trans-aconitate methyltransferase